MKKYLMSGIAVIAFAAAFTSCSKSTDLYDAGAVQQREIQKTENSYSDNFIKKYGQPAANHDWGFNAFENSTRSFTRSEFANQNQWRSLFDNVPANVDMSEGGERDKVVAEFSKKRVDARNEVNINWTEFYVYQVDRGNTTDNTYTAHDNQNRYYAAEKMNHLQTYVNGTMEEYQAGKSGVRQEHCNNFNSANNTNEVDGIKGAMMMRNSGTVDFSYHNSVDNKYHNEYIIIPGADIAPELAGYYYVGFDFCATGDIEQPTNKNMGVDRDWIFNDWIVRISPATYSKSARVACEDLGTTDDFDFNDVVFDVSPYQDFWSNDGTHNQYTVITVRAAGGTLPLYLEAGGVSKEVHELFGVETGTMVNTNNGTVSRPIAQFTIPGSVTPKQVAVKVAENAKEIELKAEVGQAPQKICVNSTFQWCNEREQIGDKYENFPAWVKDQQVKWY